MRLWNPGTRGWGLALAFAVAVALAAARSEGGVEEWAAEFPATDFSKTSIDFAEIVTDGPRRDQIPPIHDPQFVPAAGAEGIGPFEPVIGVVINGDARAYPLRILLWHEIVNDTVGGVPVLVSYCPLCNSGVVYDRRLDGRVLQFGNTGRIRHFDMVMYDLETESWWQQFLGEGIIGELTGARLKTIPARLESLARFQERAPDGKLLVPNVAGARRYGATPYIGFERQAPRALAAYGLPEGVRPMQRLVVVGGEAWTLDLIRKSTPYSAGDLVIAWSPGQNSIHDQGLIAFGRDVGNVTVQRQTGSRLADTAYDVTFAFAFRAFRPFGVIHTE